MAKVAGFQAGDALVGEGLCRVACRSHGHLACFGGPLLRTPAKVNNASTPMCVS
jgi:hypothetical protein